MRYKDVDEITCAWSKSFMEDVRNHSMKSVNQSRLYIKEANSNNE